MLTQNELTILNKAPASVHNLVQVSVPFNDSFIDNNRSYTVPPGNTTVKKR